MDCGSLYEWRSEVLRLIVYMPARIPFVTRPPREGGMANARESLYEIIGVRADAPRAEIESACIRLAGKFHSDQNPGDPIAAKNFAAIEHAFEVLGDPEKRAAYDAALLVRGIDRTAPEPIAIKQSFVGYLGASIGGLLMLVAFAAKPSEPGGIAMLIGVLVTGMCLRIAVRAVPITDENIDLDGAERYAAKINNAISSTIACLLGAIAILYFVFFWTSGFPSPKG
jgi:curved DNA-binding protein CbpA